MSNKVKLNLELAKLKLQKKDLQINELSSSALATVMYSRVLNGDVSAVETAEMLSFLSKVIDHLKKMTDENGENKFTDLVIKEIEDRGEKNKLVTDNGTTIQVTASNGKTDYSICGHPYYNYLLAEEKKISEKKKEIEKYLKTIKIPTPVGNVSNPDTGELYENITIFPIQKDDNHTYKITLLKD